MKRDLNYLLFEKPIQKRTGAVEPLFRFQSDLAKAIVRESENYKDKTANNIRPYLSQTLKEGNAPYEKPMSLELRLAIISVSKSIIHPDYLDSIDFEEEFDKAYRILKSNTYKNFASDDAEFNELKKWQSGSNRTVIFSREPLEVKWNTPNLLDSNQKKEAEELLNVMLVSLVSNFGNDERYDLIQLVKDIRSGKNIPLRSKDRNEQYFYRYFVSDYNVAKNLWQGILLYIKEELVKLNIEDSFQTTIDLLKLFNGSQEKIDENYSLETTFLKIYIVDGSINTMPIAYFESANGIIDERTESQPTKHEMLFTLLYSRSGQRSVSMIEYEDLDYWKENVYYPLYWSKENWFNKEEINLDTALAHVKRTINIPKK